MKDDKLAYECKKCCLTCDENKKTCEYRKARGRLIRREIYAAEKKKLRNQAKYKNIVIFHFII